MTEQSGSIDTVVLDVDGTLVDSVYQHTIAWSVAFRTVGVEIPAWRIHRAIGMGGDRLVTEVAGEAAEAAHGDRLRELHGTEFSAMFEQVHALPGASDLLNELRRRHLKVVLASSGEREQTDRALSLVAASDQAHDFTTSSDVARSKPAPDLVDSAIEKVGGAHALVVGDAVWDVKAAKERDLFTVGLLCGGFGADELAAAGADRVFPTCAELVEELDDVLDEAGADG
ncbi:MAG: HAD family hydrolase [Nocardioidaceae bacterium]